MFEKEIWFDPVLFYFQKGLNFTIRRGIKTKYNTGERIKLRSSMCPTKFAKVDLVQHIAFYDIANFTRWHLHERRDPLNTMITLYPNFNPFELVTLIWFTIDGEEK